MMPDRTRPDPEALLPEARREGRGRLKVFLGAAPGVGKTYAMLEAARRRRDEGASVLIGVVEAHGRAETEALLRDLEVLPRQPFYHGGRILHEMDLDALIAARPDLALIDELAHSNLSGTRHEKRWQDVEEVLAAGIDVFTTLNVQHVETLNDTVARITGIRVRETVPDRVLEEAHEIELVDLPPDELIARLRAGKVYVQDQAARAVANFFAKGNLTALRELAMRTAADRVDAQLREHMAAHAIEGPWPTQERVLVLLPDGIEGRDAVRIAKRAADRARVEWLAVGLTELSREGTGVPRPAQALRLAQRLGAEVSQLQVDRDPGAEILDYARRHNVRRVVLPRPPPRPWAARLLRPRAHERLLRQLLREGQDYELTLVADSAAPRRGPARRPRLLPADPLRDAGRAVLAVALTSALALAIDRFLPVVSLSLLYMTAVVAMAARLGLGASVATAALSFFVYNFLFTRPRYTLEVWSQSELLTLVLFLVASIVTGNLAARLRSRVIAQRAIAERTSTLYDFSRKAAAAASFDDVVWAAVSHVAAVLQGEAILLAPDAEGRLAIAGAFPPEDRIGPRELSAARYAFDHGEAAGQGSGTLPAARWLFLPLSGADRRLGVLGIATPDGRSADPAERRLLEALADQVALALERIRLSEDLAQSRVASEAERLRSALLSSVSHDLRTPLVSILGAAEGLELPGLGPEQRGALTEVIREEGERLDRYIQNLLDMSRLGHGALKPNRLPVDLRELAGAARHRLRGVLRPFHLEVQIDPRLPPVSGDPILLEQVLVNILDNAAKYSDPGAGITLGARVQGARVALWIEDHGPGLPPGSQEAVFDMFWRAEQGDGGRTGTGLGLAICRGIVEAHGGSIRAGARADHGRGTRITLDLPLSNPEALP
ncbi:sensor histidine kinase KdpD [Pseudooceanicola sp. CBS1P-1]|uniref:histidine kinase n=1 Tax=Pseudooceanicola albus TaxID=2692189 RepID=A0A6L7FZX9_9RHOB|nr:MULTISPECIES: sensor histidine kinase KdpD [Pseudooceanicola]MBT9383525.1 sensor histidine kinase KdpD [Pseudooceanicola endophyticus]MXN17381.1 DUF4118 domain-containing protein [Pseudooceanicola albus]